MPKSALFAAALLASGLALATAANAASFVVDAKANSSSGGVGLATISVTTGEQLSVFTPLSDIWSAGALPRWSDTNGLTKNLYATGTDASGQPAGTLIGQNFGTWTQNSLTAPFGSLVGEIGGVYEILGSSFNGTAWGTGTLNLYYWDSNNGDNSGSITAAVNVPEPATWGLLLVGFAGIGAALRRRAAVVARA